MSTLSPLAGFICTSFLLLVVPALAQEHRTFSVPFDRQAGLILLKGELNGKPAALLLDTGANHSIADAHSAGFDGLKLDALRSTGKVGAEGDGVVREVKLSLQLRCWLNRRVCVDGSDRRNPGPPGCARGRLDWPGCSLAKFSAVRLYYKHGTVEFEQ